MSLLQTSALRRLPVRPRCSSPRAQTVTPSSRRHFSAWDTFNAISESTAQGICNVHAASGLPWWVSIALVAAGVNFTVRLPLQAYSRNLQNQRMKVQPLVDAWAARHTSKIGQGETASNGGSLMKERIKALTRSRKRIYNDFDCQIWKSFIPIIVGSVPFLTVTNSLRRIAGSDTITSTSHGLPLLDQSITEGGALWFTDLTVADPYLILPAACSAVLFAQVFRGLSWEEVKKKVTQSNKTVDTSVQGILGRVLLFFPFVPFALNYLPAGIFVYWLSTFSLSHVNQALLDRIRPHPKRTLNIPPKTMQTAPTPWIQSANYELGKSKASS